MKRAREFKESIAPRMDKMDPNITITEILRWKAKIDFDKNFTGEQGYERTLYTISIIEKSYVGKMPIRLVKPAQLESFLKSITRYSNTVIGKVHGQLRTAFRIAYDAKVVEMNYMLLPELRCPKSVKMDKKVRGLTDEEQSLFLDALRKHKPQYGRNDYRLQMLMELYGGFRMGEINAMRPENIHLREGYVHVDATVSRGLEFRTFINDRTKTYAGIRDVPINSYLRPVLEEALSQMKPNPEGLLFYDFNKNGIIETSQVNCQFRRLAEKAGIPQTGQHSLRHTFATRCIEAGVPAVVLKKWLGHTDIHITLDTYADVYARMDFDATDKFDEHIKMLDEEWKAHMESDD